MSLMVLGGTLSLLLLLSTHQHRCRHRSRAWEWQRGGKEVEGKEEEGGQEGRAAISDFRDFLQLATGKHPAASSSRYTSCCFCSGCPEGQCNREYCKEDIVTLFIYQSERLAISLLRQHKIIHGQIHVENCIFVLFTDLLLLSCFCFSQSLLPSGMF